MIHLCFFRNISVFLSKYLCFISLNQTEYIPKITGDCRRLPEIAGDYRRLPEIAGDYGVFRPGGFSGAGTHRAPGGSAQTFRKLLGRLSFVH